MHKQIVSVRRVTIAAMTVAAVSLPIVTVAQAQQADTTGIRYRTLSAYRQVDQAIARPSPAYSDSDRSEVAYRNLHYPGWSPNAHGGTTGGSVNPGVLNDHREHGDNGG